MTIRCAIPLAILSLAALATSGCSSQVDSFNVPDVREPVVSPGGIYFGRTTFQSSPAEVEVTALIDVNSRFFLLADDGHFLASGQYATTGRGFTAQARFHDLSAVAPPLATDFVGAYEPEAEVSGTFIRADGEVGSINLVYQPQTLQGSLLPRLAGDWVEPDAFGDNLTLFSFDGGGAFFGNDSNDCTYSSARVNLIDTRFNVYRVQFSRSCTGDDTPPRPFSGLLTQVETVVAGRATPQLIIGASNNTDAVSFRLIPAK